MKIASNQVKIGYETTSSVRGSKPADTLGFEAELDRTDVNSVKHGKRNISLVTNIRLAQALNVEPARLLRNL